MSRRLRACSQGLGLSIALVLLFVTVGLSGHVSGYIDLGTGSYMLQLLAAGVFGGIFAAKSLWLKIRAAVRPPHPRAR